MKIYPLITFTKYLPCTKSSSKYFAWINAPNSLNIPLRQVLFIYFLFASKETEKKNFSNFVKVTQVEAGKQEVASGLAQNSGYWILKLIQIKI